MSGRKRKTAVVKRFMNKTPSQTGHGAFGGLKYGGFSFVDPLAGADEETCMEAEEKRQTKVDRFWGQDKDLFDRQVEKLLMQAEEDLSKSTENYYKTKALHSQWDLEQKQNEIHRNKMLQNYKQIEREHYIKLITMSTVSSENVINTIWNVGNNQYNQTPQYGHALTEFNNSSSIESLQNSFVHQTSTLTAPSTANGEMSRSMAAGSVTPHHSVGLSGPVHMSIHLDGLQQSKAIIDKASYSFKQTLRRLNTNSSDIEDATQPFKTAPPTRDDKPRLTPGAIKNKVNTFLDKTVKGLESHSTDSKEPPSVVEIWDSIKSNQIQHNDILDGHPIHKWDQEEMLLAVFNMLDTGSKGYLVMDDMLPISHSREIHNLLKFTVFWSVIKKKKWSFFEEMFEKAAKAHKNNNYYISESLFNYNTGSTVSNTSNKQVLAPLTNGKNVQIQSTSSVNSCTNSLTYADWIASAECLAKEFKIRVKHIRTNDEHMKYAQRDLPTTTNTTMTPNNKQTGQSTSVSGKFRPNDEYDIQRETYLSRVLNVGDCVWGLHAKGCVWLPAVIEQIHTNYESIPTNNYYPSTSISSAKQQEECKSYYTYDIWYPINQRVLNQSRAMSASRALLSLPSALDTHLLHPKSIYGERNICAYAYDIVDQNCSGVVELHRLVTCFLSPEFRKIIHTSLALYTIFANSKYKINSAAANNGRGTMYNNDTHTVSPRGNGLLQPLDNSKQNMSGNQLYNENNSSVYLIEDSVADSTEINALNVPSYTILDKANIPCLLPVFIDTFTTKPQMPSPKSKHTTGPSSSKPPLTKDSNTSQGSGSDSKEVDKVSKPSTPPQRNKLSRRSMEQEDANLRELLLLHGHLPAEVASMTTRTSFSVQTEAIAAATAAVNAMPDNTGLSAVNENSTTDQDFESLEGEDDLAGDGIDWISKFDFLEFCVATVDIIQYSII